MKRISDKDIARFFEKYQDEIIQMELSDLPTDEELSQVHIPAEYDRRIEQLIDDYSHQSKKATHTGRRIAILILLNRFKIAPPRLISVYHLLNYVARIVKIFFEKIAILKKYLDK